MDSVSEASQRLRKSILPAVETCLQQYRESVLSYNENRLAAYEGEMDSLTMQLERLKANIEGEEAAISFIKDQIKDLEKDIEVQSQDYQSIKENQCENSVKEKISNAERISKGLAKALNCYQSRLGLSLKRLPNSNLRISFEYVKREIDEFEHTVTVSIDTANLYKVEDCIPRLDNLHILLHNLNQTNDFSRFVKDLRKNFVNLYN